MNKFKWAISSFGGVIFLVLVWSGSTWFMEYRRAQLIDRQATAIGVSLDEKLVDEKCGGLGGTELALCVVSAFERDRADVRQQQDLKAQQDMASWALVLLGISSLSLAASFGGLWALVWTFLETRKINRADGRAYVLGTKFVVSKIWVSDDDSHYQLEIEVEFLNSGSTPAFDVTILGRPGWNTLENMQSWEPNSTPTSRGVLGPGQSWHQNRRIELNFSDETVQFNIDMNATVWTRGVVQYRDVYDHWWEHCFMYKLKDPTVLLNSRISRPEGKTYLDIGLTVHDEMNSLRRIPPPTTEIT